MSCSSTTISLTKVLWNIPQKPYYSFIYSVSCWNFTAAIFLPYTDKVSEFVFFVFYWQNNYIIIIIIEPAIHIL